MQAVKRAVAKLQGDGTSEFKLSNGRSRSYREIKMLLPTEERAVAKLQGDLSASQCSMELYDTWISAPFRVS